MTPDEIAVVAKKVHDQEGWNLGSGSTREYRNEYWARVVGIVHFGHPQYNPTPDPRWYLKDGGNGRPQSDDVAVLMPERLFWDFIGGAGANGYSFRAGSHGNDRLPMEQNVYPPPRPKGSGPVDPPVDPPIPTDVIKMLKDLGQGLADVIAKLNEHDRALNQAANEALNAASRASEIKTQIANLPQSKVPGYVGRGSTKAFGGAFTITLTPTGE